MKPRPFDYARPDTVEEALAILAEHGDDARVLAGGQTLMAMLNLRLVAPEVVVDITRIPELDVIREVDGKIEVGAAVTQNRLLAWPALAEKLPLLAAAPQTHVDHPGLVKLHWQQAAKASTFREMTTFEMIDLLHEMDFHHIELVPGQSLSPERKDVKISPEMSPADVEALLAKLKAVKMDIVSFGVAEPNAAV